MIKTVGRQNDQIINDNVEFPDDSPITELDGGYGDKGLYILDNEELGEFNDIDLDKIPTLWRGSIKYEKLPYDKQPRARHNICMSRGSWMKLNALVEEDNVASNCSRAIEMLIEHYLYHRDSLPLRFKNDKILNDFKAQCERKGLLPGEVISSLILSELESMKKPVDRFGS